MTPKHLHIIGICGTAMAGLAALAQGGGMRVTGSDANVYPPMSTFLENKGITLMEGFKASNLDARPDLVLVGNAISRGNPELEAVLDLGLPYRSGAEWLCHHVLEGRKPIVAAGTHGKTSTASLAAWTWESAGLQPGFLIGGIPLDFGEGARFPGGDFVVVEGDEYDTAYWDKRSKFLHYRTHTLLLNNLEYDHADIFPDMEAIRVQFRLLLKTVPSSGLIVMNGEDGELEGIVASGCWTPVIRYGIDGDFPIRGRMESLDGRRWSLLRDGKELIRIDWALTGRHNVMNGLAVAAAALHHGLTPEVIKKGFESHKGVARRMELRGKAGGVAIFDDFAHHPTAMETTLAGFGSEEEREGRVWAIVEPRSNTMRRRFHQDRLAPALKGADRVILARPAPRGLSPEELLDVEAVVAEINVARPGSAFVADDASLAIEIVVEHSAPGDKVVVMSNGGFDGIHERLQQALLGAMKG